MSRQAGKASQHRAGEGTEDHGDPCPLVQTVALTRDYPGIRALDNVEFSLRAGEVHVLFGENGAGKSTLISMLAGATMPTSGQILFRGRAVEFDNVHAARNLGISAVFQEFSLIPQMSVAENMFLGAEERRRGLLHSGAQTMKARAVLDDLDFRLDPTERIDRLSRAEQQMVEIAKAFRSDLSVLILDEPTASLTSHETDHLFALLRRLRKQDVGIVYITHRIAEIREIGDRVTILRDGRFVDTVDAKSTSEDELVRLMTGRVVGEVFPKVSSEPGDTVLEVRNLHTDDGSLNGVSATVRKGEIVGLAGLIGSGKSRFGKACFGAVGLRRGTVTFKGERIPKPTPRTMLDRGLLYLPPDRRDDGLMMMRPAFENMSLAAVGMRPFSNGWIVDGRRERKITGALAERLKLAPPRLDRTTEQFSGGNQQKLMLARSLTRRFDLLIFDEPTVGVDVGTRSAIYEFIAELCELGAAVLLISSDLPEILNLSSRVYVFFGGSIQVELAGDQINEENVLASFFEREAA